jgi:hypothetical protein
MSGRSERVIATAAYYGFNLSLVVSAALLLGVLALDLHAVWLEWAKLVFGLALAVEGFVLAMDWHGARRLTVARIRRRGKQQTSLLGSVAWKLASPVLEVVGIAWVLTGLLAAGLGLTRIV